MFRWWNSSLRRSAVCIRITGYFLWARRTIPRTLIQGCSEPVASPRNSRFRYRCQASNTASPSLSPGHRVQNEIIISDVASQLEGASAADLQAIHIAAKRVAFNRKANNDQLSPLLWSNFETATFVCAEAEIRSNRGSQSLTSMSPFELSIRC